MANAANCGWPNSAANSPTGFKSWSSSLTDARKFALKRSEETPGFGVRASLSTSASASQSAATFFIADTFFKNDSAAFR